MRYGTDEGLLDFGTGKIVKFEPLMTQFLELIHDDAVHLGCEKEAEHALVIADRGTSAHELLTASSAATGSASSAESSTARFTWLSLSPTPVTTKCILIAVNTAGTASARSACSGWIRPPPRPVR